MSRMLISLGLLLVTAGTVSAAVIDGFETQSPGDLNGQENWSVSLLGGSPPTAPGASVVTTPAPYAGSQSLHIVDDTTGWVNAIKTITPEISTGTIFSFAARALFDPAAGKMAIGIQASRTFSDGTLPIERGSIYFLGDTGQIGMYDGSSLTVLTTWVKDNWYLFDLTSNTDGGGNISQHVKITNTTTSTVVYNNTLSAGTDAGRTHYGRIRVESSSVTTGEYQFDSFSLVPEPSSLSLLGLGALAMLRRRK